nr:MAG TPA: hypothetical protein [Caudoviricetes sp.]
MSQELVSQTHGGDHPFHQFQQGSMPSPVNAGSVSIEQQRAIAEAQGQLMLAKRFPRDLNAAFAELMEACRLPALAAVAFYTLPRGKSSVTGPSIRLAEEIARVYGNFQYGHRELSRDDKKSEVEVYAWDMEKNNYSKRQITVMHVLDTKEGPRKLRDQKDIDDKIANVASKQVRGRILALVPKWLSEAAIAACRETLAGNSEIPVAERVRKMTQVFAKFGVTTKHLEGFLGHGLDTVNTDEIADLTGIFNAIKDGAKIADYFGEVETEANVATAEALTLASHEGAQQRQQQAKKATPARQTKPKPEPQPDPREATPEAGAEEESNSVEENSNTVEEPTPENPANSPSADAEQTADDAAAPQTGEPDDVF